MLKKITILTEIVTIFLCYIGIAYSIEVQILPIKKPQLNKETQEKKISKNIIKPKKKPLYNIVEETIIKEKQISKQKKIKLFLNQNHK